MTACFSSTDVRNKRQGGDLWTEEESDQVCELLVINRMELVAHKLRRSLSSAKQLCGRLEIRVREVRCDLFSINSLAAAVHLRKAEIVWWIDRGWLEAMRENEAKSTRHKIQPETLQRCLRERSAELQERNLRSATILAVFKHFCDVPKHTAGEELRHVREAKRSRRPTSLQLQSTSKAQQPFRLRTCR